MNNSVYNDYGHKTNFSFRSMDVTTFFSKVYMSMGAGLFLTFLTSFVFYYFNLTTAIPQGMFWVLLISQLAVVWVLSRKLELSKSPNTAESGLSTTSAYGLFFLYSILTGVTLSTIFYVYDLDSILVVLGATTTMFVALSIVGRVTKKDLSAMGKFLFVALIGIIITSIINMFMQNSQLDFIVSIAGVLIFAGLIVYDNNILKKMYENGFVNEGNLVVFGALTLYLDFINLFLYLLRLFGNKD